MYMYLERATRVVSWASPYTGLLPIVRYISTSRFGLSKWYQEGRSSQLSEKNGTMKNDSTVGLNPGLMSTPIKITIIIIRKNCKVWRKLKNSYTLSTIACYFNGRWAESESHSKSPPYKVRWNFESEFPSERKTFLCESFTHHILWLQLQCVSQTYHSRKASPFPNVAILY